MTNASGLMPATLYTVEDIARDVRLFTLAPHGGCAAYQVGSHIDVQVWVDGVSDTRSFSLIGEPQEAPGYYRIAVKNRPDGHGGSRYLWSLTPGDRLLLGAPRDRFPLSQRAGEYLLIAGGIGITPIYGMARALAARGARLRLLYAARSAEQLAFAGALRERLGARLQVYVTGRGERIDPAAAIAGLADDGELYVCGPMALREDCLRAWLDAGRPRAAFRFETFASSGRYPDQAFEVRVANRDLRVRVDRGQSLLQALRQAGVDEVLHDCEHGECGLCTVAVLGGSGVIDHRDVFYSERQQRENNRICTCVSRVYGGDLVIDTERQRVDTGRGHG